MAFSALVRQWIVWKAAWQAESGQPPHTTVPKGLAAEFLPEALDIQQVPPSPIGRALLWTILVACATGAVWAMLVRIDSVTTAHGKVVSSGDSKKIHLAEAGVITAIHVRNGQPVKQGDVLIELDPAKKIAERDRAGKEYRATRVEAARLRALLKSQATLEVPADADGDELRFQQRLLWDQLAEHQAKIVEAQHVVDQRRAAVMQTKETLVRLEAALALETERAEQAKKLLERELGARKDFLKAESRRIDKVQEVNRQQQTLQDERAALVQAEQESHALVSDFQQAKQGELSALEAKAALLAQEATKVDQKAGFQRVLSPMDGVVQQLTAQTVGTVVTPTQPVLTLVSLDHSVEVEAQVEKKDIGVVQQGQSVEIKIEPFQAASHGTITGHVLTVPDSAGSITTMERVSPIKIRLDRSTIQVGSTAVTLTPGMAVRVEIKTGPRPMVEYLLDPVRQAMSERVKEWNVLVHSARGFIDR